MPGPVTREAILMDIKRVGSQPSAKGPRSGSRARCGSIHFFKHLIRHWFKAPA